MSKLKFIFRADNTNVGDWWCPPWRYFPFKPGIVGDILDSKFQIDETDTLLVGGGGLGNEFFRPHLKRIKEAKPKVSILWGAGVDSVSKRDTILADEKQDLYGDYFDFFDEQGIRVFSNPQRFQYVPCASCMNNLLFKYWTSNCFNTRWIFFKIIKYLFFLTRVLRGIINHTIS